MKSKKDEIKKARDFFENIVKIYGENQLYRVMYGELPIDDDTEERIRKMRMLYEEAEPLKKEIYKHINQKRK